jgi:hypothetical protein
MTEIPLIIGLRLTVTLDLQMISKASPAPSKPEPKGKEKKTTKVIETLNPGSVKDVCISTYNSYK